MLPTVLVRSMLREFSQTLTTKVKEKERVVGKTSFFCVLNEKTWSFTVENQPGLTNAYLASYRSQWKEQLNVFVSLRNASRCWLELIHVNVYCNINRHHTFNWFNSIKTFYSKFLIVPHMISLLLLLVVLIKTGEQIKQRKNEHLTSQSCDVMIISEFNMLTWAALCPAV